MLSIINSGRGAMATVSAFLLGLPLGVAMLWAIEAGPWQHPELVRYISHPVEKAEVLLFTCALMALVWKFLGSLRERMVFSKELLPAWNGKPLLATQAAGLQQHLEMHSGWRSTWLGMRIGAILDFVKSRGSANELDDQMRTLSDNDAMTQEGSYSLLRFITWAIPILGFLGTVLGITDAVANVTPEVLEQSLSGVTGGLATAFDTTAVALCLTMVLMFATYITERLEQGLLQKVDAYVDRHLAHRFERTGPESGQFIEALRKNTQVLLQATEQLVEKQAGLWAKSLEKMERHGAELSQKQHAQMTASLHQAMEAALMRQEERLSRMEDQMMGRSQALVDGLGKLAVSLGEMTRQHTQTLAQLTAQVAAQTESLARLQEGEGQILRLQESLQQNLNALASSGAFEQAIQSLTGAIHLLTSRAQPALTVRKAA